MLRSLLGLSGALLLAACGCSSPADDSATIPAGEPAGAVVASADGPRTLTAEDLTEAAAFYRRKTVSIIVGSGAGGGFDTTARLVARHIGRHIPGTPTVIVVNMPGGGGLVAANNLFNVAPKDGTVIGLFHEAQVMNQLTGGEGVQFDILKFNWLGSSYDDPNVCIIRSDAPVKTFRDLIGRAEPIAIGGTGPGSNSHDAPQVVARATGASLRTISGYSSTNDVRLGIERGEVQGLCLGWESVRSTCGEWLDNGYAHVFVQNGTVRHRDLPDVPLALEFARDEESRMILKLLDAPSSMSKPFALPPGVDPARVQVMRSALSATYRDPLFLAEAAAMRLDFQPRAGDEIHQLLSEMLATPKAIAAKYRQVVQP
jgi:tripartite-type tricarboxylate transporter receptor subunit TctC